MNLIIGREGNQPFAIRDTGVSRRHVSLELQVDGQLIIEDLASANGTFVNGMRVVKKQIQPTDEVRLGPTYLLNLSDTVRIMQTTSAAAPAKSATGGKPKTEVSPEEQQRIRTEFAKLEDVYNKYIKDQIKLRQERSMAMVMRMMPAAVTGALTFVLPLFLEGNTASTLKMVLGGISILLVCVFTFNYFRVQKKAPEKEIALGENFKSAYVCPKCNSFLGKEPFENLKKRGQCKSCKAIWV